MTSKVIEALQNEARIDAIYSMHDSIMRGELQWGDIREDAWLNGTIHKWIDKVIESGDTTSTSFNGKYLDSLDLEARDFVASKEDR